jgi:hypothetical protein
MKKGLRINCTLCTVYTVLNAEEKVVACKKKLHGVSKVENFSFPGYFIKY